MEQFKKVAVPPSDLPHQIFGAIGFLEGEGKGLKSDPTAKVVGLDAPRGKACPSCGQFTMMMVEGCMTCASCGHSKCG